MKMKRGHIVHILNIYTSEDIHSGGVGPKPKSMVVNVNGVSAEIESESGIQHYGDSYVLDIKAHRHKSLREISLFTFLPF